MTDSTHHRPRSRLLLVVLVALAVLAAACGGDDGADETAPPDAAATPTAEATGETDGDQPTPTPVPDREDQPEVDESACPVDALDDAEIPVQISLWHSMSATNGEVLEELVAEYNGSQERVRVTPSFQGVYVESFEKYVNTLRTGGERPDVIQSNELAQQQMVDSQSIVPIQACVDADGYDLGDFVGGLIDQYRIGDVLVSMPFQLSNPVLYYNGQTFRDAALDPDQPPRTLDELVEISRALVDSGVVPQGIAMDIDGWVIEQWINMAGTPVVDNDNGRSARATATLLDSDAAAAAYETMATLRDEGLIVNTGRGSDQSAINKYLAVAFGDAAMTIGSSSTLGEIYTQIGQFPTVELRVAQLPGPTGGGTAIGGGSLYLTDDTEPEVRAAAWDFMKWLNEPAQQISWSAGTGYIPTRQSAIGDPALEELWAERPGFRVAFDQLAEAGPLPGGGGPVIGDHAGVREAIEQSLEALFAGASAADAQAQAVEQANQAIADYNRRIGG